MSSDRKVSESSPLARRTRPTAVAPKMKMAIARSIVVQKPMTRATRPGYSLMNTPAPTPGRNAKPSVRPSSRNVPRMLLR